MTNLKKANFNVVKDAIKHPEQQWESMGIDLMTPVELRTLKKIDAIKDYWDRKEKMQAFCAKILKRETLLEPNMYIKVVYKKSFPEPISMLVKRFSFNFYAGIFQIKGVRILKDGMVGQKDDRYAALQDCQIYRRKLDNTWERVTSLEFLRTNNAS